MRLVMSDAEFQEIELRAILKKLELVPVPPAMPEQVVSNIVVSEPQPVVNELVVSKDGLIDVLEAEVDIAPVVIVPIGVPEMDNED